MQFDLRRFIASGRAKQEQTFDCDLRSVTLVPVCAYCVVQTDPDDRETSEDIWGMLYYAEITEFEQELHNEIAKIEFFESPPAALTYPQIQPHLLREAQRRGFC